MSSSFSYQNYQDALSLLGSPSRIGGYRVFVTDHAVEKIDIPLSRWHRVRCWFEDRADEWDLIWPFNRVERVRTKPVVWRDNMGNFYMHSAIHKALRESEKYPGGFAYDPFIVAGLM